MKNMQTKWDHAFMRVVKEMETLSTCGRIHVGCVITKDNRIISTGYNGVPAGQLHCVDYFYQKYVDEYEKYFPKWTDYIQTIAFSESHHEFAIKNELHAEQNAIAIAAKHGIKLKNTTMYVSYNPCFQCAKLIIASGIKTIIYEKKYLREDTTEFLTNNGITIIQLQGEK